MDKTMLERENKALRAKLLRRSEIIDTIRKAYIADVVTVKEALINFGWAHQAIASEPADEIRECSDFGHNAPSLTVHDILVGLPRLDLREALMKESQVIHDLGLYAPDDCFLEKWHCDSCGGHLEIVMKGNKKVSMMAKEIEELETKMREILDQNITLNQSVNVLTEKLETQSKLNAEESDLQRKKMRLANAAWEDEFDKLQSNRLIEIEGYAAALATSKNQLKKTKKELDFAMSQLKFSSAQANAKQFSDSKLIEDLKGNHKMEIDTLMQLLNRSEEKVSQLERTCKENILQFEDARNSDFLLKEELKRCNMEVEVTKALLESTNKQNVQVMQGTYIRYNFTQFTTNLNISKWKFGRYKFR